MNKCPLDIDKIQSNRLFKEMHSYGLINELVLRNLVIQSEYLELRKTYHQIESIFILSERHHLSYYAINNILFRKRTNKPIYGYIK
ncbi:MAG: hypothetical protein A2499_04875 [Stygiobacter sp. RIFOXYC12_FULL_38_8]|nr:MAG: hypothetical protein A2299_16245 [Stygiobacter sp. RIFOXYB2_FULL_37_11]OGV13458.1 MAG: hypothetical protein A2237_16940 [Stygiobacter sp. RIFOXYA2_FULL_38_8]OGV14749.1 MAG: hypothetical protein A2440_09625 [Stygiobacter sp. RIFOXYC2_FULL_38_25]OGV22285.1 MAG: hypothetical protein A2499_04875 [Stygiobacter sp. RIFOXYC12_FULL_38_8]OGV79242.1 MAG: hypothetical protein A2X65_01995 [Stygiobacter sp. GWF2_38_21]